MGLAPTGKRRLVTAHTHCGPSCASIATPAYAPERTLRAFVSAWDRSRADQRNHRPQAAVSKFGDGKAPTRLTPGSAHAVLLLITVLLLIKREHVAQVVPLYAARIEDLGPGDFVRVDCAACSHTALLAPAFFSRAWPRTGISLDRSASTEKKSEPSNFAIFRCIPGSCDAGQSP